MDSEKRHETPAQDEPRSKTVTCAPCDDENCCCNSGKTPRSKTIIFATVMLLAVGVATYSMVKKNSAAALGVPSASASKGDSEVGSLTEIRLDSVEAAEKLATERDVTFLVLPGQDATSTNAACDQVSAAFGKLLVQGQKAAAFTIPESAGAYKGLMERFRIAACPCVVVLGNGGRPSAVAGEITETKLLRAAVMAGLRSNCCPGGSCCPATGDCSGPACCPPTSPDTKTPL
ncbi:MAG: hypothetical protein ACYC35_03525 [Pirellulales bacterium]